MKYLFLSSKDSLRDYPNNKWYDFTVDLPCELILEGDWECALLDINCIPRVDRELVVYCDIVEQSYFNNGTASLLRCVFQSTNTFLHPYYIKINRNRISHARICIRDLVTGRVPSEYDLDLTCTLGLHQKSKQNKAS